MISQVSNVVMKFNWLIYIPDRGPSMLVRTFVAALLEMLRRWQWNFCTCSFVHLSVVLTSFYKIVLKMSTSVTWISTASQEKCLFHTTSTELHRKTTGMMTALLADNGALI